MRRAAPGGREWMGRLRPVLAAWFAWGGATLMVWAMKLLDEDPHDGKH